MYTVNMIKRYYQMPEIITLIVNNYQGQKREEMKMKVPYFSSEYSEHYVYEFEEIICEEGLDKIQRYLFFKFLAGRKWMRVEIWQK